MAALGGASATSVSPPEFTKTYTPLRIDGKVNGVDMPIIVDTGSGLSIASLAVVNQLSLTIQPWSGPIISAINGERVRPIGCVNLNLIIASHRCNVWAAVVKEFPCDLLLGTRWCASEKVTVCFKEHKLSLPNGNRVPFSIAVLPEGPLPFDIFEEKISGPTTLLCKEDIVVPAKSHVFLVLDLEKPVSYSEGLVLPKSLDYGKNQIAIPYSLATIKENKVSLCVTNFSKEDQLLNSNTKLASIESVETDPVNLVNMGSFFPPESTSQPVSFNLGPNLSFEEREKITELLNQYQDCFGSDLGVAASEVKHTIDTGSSKPISQHPYRCSATARQEIEKQVNEMLQKGVISPSKSPWSSPVVLVPKPDGSLRFCVDFRKLNAVTIKDVYPLPRIDSVIDAVQGSTWFSALDLASGYWQIPLSEQDKAKTGFVTQDGLFEFNVMPFGLCNAPATFQRYMDVVLAGFKWNVCLVYLDDIIIFSKSFTEHLKHLHSVLACIRKVGLRLKPEKCFFGLSEITYLGHVISADGVKPTEKNVNAIAQFSEPKSVKDVRAFVGLCSYYRRFVPNFAQIANPLTELTKKNVTFVWGTEQQKAFDSLKSALMSSPVLAHYDPDKPLEIRTDGCGIGLGVVVVQPYDDGVRVVAYASRTLLPAETRYTVSELECLAVVWAINKFRPYVYGRHFTVVTDHIALRYLQTLKDPNMRLTRWSLLLQEFDFEVKTKKGTLHRDADALSRYPVKDTETYSPEVFVSPLMNVADLQRQDPKWGIMIKNLEKGLPVPKEFVLREGILYKQLKDKHGIKCVMLIPRGLRSIVLRSCHDDPSSGAHLGIDRTWKRIRDRYFWPNLFNSVRKYVLSCTLCQTRKSPPVKPAGLLQSIPVGEPFSKIAMDFLGPFPVSVNNNRHVLVCTDYGTRWVEAVALPNATAEKVAECLLLNVVLRHGTPREFLSDRGSAFMAHVVTYLLKLLHVNKQTTTAYHPQCNGLTERFNGTLASMISMYVNAQHSDWDEFLPHVVFAYNTSYQESMRTTPFYLVYGRQAVLPLDAVLLPVTPYDVAQRMSYISKHLVTARQLARDNLAQSQSKSRERYNAVHREVSYVPGQKVWLWVPARKKGLAAKLMHYYKGPYLIIKSLGPVDYELQHCSTGKIVYAHVTNLKLFYSADSDKSGSESESEESDDDVEDDVGMMWKYHQL